MDTTNSTVFIVDDDPAVRQGLAMLVKSMQLQAECFASAQEYLQVSDPDRPGCLLIDVRMPGMSGLELLDRLAARGVHLPAIMISAYGDVPMVVRAMKSGATDFLEKPCRDHELWEAIQSALQRDAENRRRKNQRVLVGERLERLTPGEQEVLEMLVEGGSNKAIAAKLGLSVRTIEVRRAKIMRKMEADSLAELVRLALATNESFGEPQTSFGNLY